MVNGGDLWPVKSAHDGLGTCTYPHQGAQQTHRHPTSSVLEDVSNVLELSM